MSSGLRTGLSMWETRTALIVRMIEATLRTGTPIAAPTRISDASACPNCSVPLPTSDERRALLAEALHERARPAAAKLGVVRVRREGTSLRYTANTVALEQLLRFLYAECCTRSCACDPAQVLNLAHETRRHNDAESH